MPSLNVNLSRTLEQAVNYMVEIKSNLDKKNSFTCLLKRRTFQFFSQFEKYLCRSHATNLLLKAKISIANICFECGFKSISYFDSRLKNLPYKPRSTPEKHFVPTEE
ncbi:hypothetical protein Phep_2292 [Pedobacter heparinus DSM 2366]|uniref:Helix-turn-helix-domain containing protein AraC type n=1 Tax=Pedobacter heparinus (strain ATCC 13125 / DSM 2366 / CIP 104194 / JCM 7457 / NBRC 12017 / NCIMB 9290 / NRRL B-14731 / HIM 762-3) TaxID=485917 RepID=C6XYL4_PEDHD|nr:hypothetical protein Phep_2292 [Pedobacter heparinus DSM 2366]